ncbi:MAG: VanZ family protein [Leucobacter sp.]|nr:VanZ family protein [Leucobacter sp.]
MLDTTHTQHRTPTDISAAERGDATIVTAMVFVSYLFLLTWAIVWKLGVPYASTGFGAVKLVPFTANAGFGPSAPGEVAANFLVFVPYGIILAALVPRRQRMLGAGIIAATSLSYEFLQFVLGVGAADTTDVLVNTAGGMIGIALFATSSTRNRRGYAGVLSRAGVFGLLVAIVLSSVLVLFADTR